MSSVGVSVAARDEYALDDIAAWSIRIKLLWLVALMRSHKTIRQTIVQGDSKGCFFACSVSSLESVGVSSISACCSAKAQLSQNLLPILD
jgi:hypothetical protein